MYDPAADLDVEPVVLRQRHDELLAEAGVQEHHARAIGQRVRQVQASVAGALLRQVDQVLQPLPLELVVPEQHLRPKYR